MESRVVEFILGLGFIIVVPLICLGAGLCIMILAVIKENSRPQKNKHKFTLERQKEVE